MSDSSTGSAPEQRLTPWVGRLMVLQAAIVVLLLTVVTAPSVFQSLEFGPALALRRPWTFVSYLFAHAGVLPLVLNLLLLKAVGPSLERRMGGREFVLFFLYCGIGAAGFALGLTSFMDVPPMSGAGGGGGGLTGLESRAGTVPRTRAIGEILAGEARRTHPTLVRSGGSRK